MAIYVFFPHLPLSLPLPLPLPFVLLLDVVAIVSTLTVVLALFGALRDSAKASDAFLAALA